MRLLLGLWCTRCTVLQECSFRARGHVTFSVRFVCSLARLQVIAVSTTTGAPTPNVLAVLAITNGREPLASDLGVREAALDSPVLPLPPTAYPSLHPYTPSVPRPVNLATLNCCRHASHASGASDPSRTASNPARTPSCACAVASVGDPHTGCCSSAISALAHANPFLLLAETGNFRQGGRLAYLYVPTAFGFPHDQELRARRASRLAPR